ncbi:hypothetical protein WN55_00290 [Dufourea novaeangliae]|uniref:Uncharacterized protein n=1 Tax=Dufourea novaeangliae TaxID=178035 RepID=A0A154PCL2_DUFNO|nr:hypothetical protein WN55_00290 [Dufourea novaeangliae]
MGKIKSRRRESSSEDDLEWLARRIGKSERKLMRRKITRSLLELRSAPHIIAAWTDMLFFVMSPGRQQWGGQHHFSAMYTYRVGAECYRNGAITRKDVILHVQISRKFSEAYHRLPTLAAFPKYLGVRKGKNVWERKRKENRKGKLEKSATAIGTAEKSHKQRKLRGRRRTETNENQNSGDALKDALEISEGLVTKCATSRQEIENNSVTELKRKEKFLEAKYAFACVVLQPPEVILVEHHKAYINISVSSDTMMKLAGMLAKRWENNSTTTRLTSESLYSDNCKSNMVEKSQPNLQSQILFNACYKVMATSFMQDLL